MMNKDILLGKTQEHLVPLPGTKFLVHGQMLENFLRLKKDALSDGFDLQIISAFRDYERQLRIWTQKASGLRPLLDNQERQLDYSSLSPKEIMFAILRWSALPGCSRHHWGTDIDVFDGRSQTAEEVQLIPSETIQDGPAALLHEWLDKKISSNTSYGFYRPYSSDLGGVSPERWHLSFYPVAHSYLENFNYSLFKQNIEDSNFPLRKELLENAEEIYQRFLITIDHP